MAPIYVFLLFVGSGAAALIYEIVWFQVLQLAIGSSTISVGVLLGTFMGGMCLGSLLGPRVIARRRHPLHVYAVLELLIGVIGIVLLFVMPLVGRVYLAWAGDGLGGFLLRSLVATICLLPPTLAMGATLPAIARWTAATPVGASWLGFFYSGNIAGAAVGSLIAGFYLLRVHDIAVATCVAAAVNVVVAAGALAMSASGPDPRFADDPPDQGARAAPGLPGAARVHLAIALSGFCALAAEVIWTRQLGLLFGATVYTFSIILAVFLIGLGSGSAVGSALSRRVEHPRLAFGWCQMLSVGAIAWTAHMLGNSLPYWPVDASISTSIWFNVQLDFLRALWAIAPAPILWGASFPLALAAVTVRGADPGRLVGRLYAANTAGAIFGALGASLVLVAWMGSQRAQQLMMACAALAGLLMLAPICLPGSDAADGSSRSRTRWPAVSRAGRTRPAALLAALAASTWLAGMVPPVPRLLVAHGRHAANWRDHSGEIFYVGEGLESSVAVSRDSSGVLSYHNAGKIEASSQPQDMRLQRMLGHVTTLVPGAPRSVLVIGCGAGVTAGAASIDPAVERITIVEIEPLVPKVVSTYFMAQNHDVIRSPKVRVRIDDARHFLLTTKDSFDAITSDPLDPWVKGAATLYTREFWEAAKRHLNPGGVVTVFVQLYESSPEAVKSEIATFFDVFPNGFILGNVFDGRAQDTVLVGQLEPSIDVDLMDWRLKQPAYAAVARSLGEVGIYSVVDLLAGYAGSATDLKEWLRDASINSDRNLRLQYLAGLGLNLHVGDRIYADMLSYRRFPEDFFVSSEWLSWQLRQAIENVRE